MRDSDIAQLIVDMLEEKAFEVVGEVSYTNAYEVILEDLEDMNDLKDIDGLSCKKVTVTVEVH